MVMKSDQVKENGQFIQIKRLVQGVNVNEM